MQRAVFSPPPGEAKPAGGWQGSFASAGPIDRPPAAAVPMNSSTTLLERFIVALGPFSLRRSITSTIAKPNISERSRMFNEWNVQMMMALRLIRRKSARRTPARMIRSRPARHDRCRPPRSNRWTGWKRHHRRRSSPAMTIRCPNRHGHRPMTTTGAASNCPLVRERRSCRAAPVGNSRVASARRRRRRRRWCPSAAGRRDASV
jgi:hypothetical protein